MSIWEKISRRNEEADAMRQSIPFQANSSSCKCIQKIVNLTDFVEFSRNFNEFLEKMEAVPTSFSKINKEYHRFLSRRKEKIKNVQYLEK